MPIQSMYLITFAMLYTMSLPAQELSDLIEQELTDFPPCEVALGIIDSGDLWKFGYQISEDSLLVVDNHATLFEIASISKVFVAALLSGEMQKGTMTLEDPLVDHLNFMTKIEPFQGQSLRIKHLVTHTSGLKRNPLMSYKRYANYLQSFELDYVPGKIWDYNNLTVGLLAELVAQKHQSTWPDLLKADLLRPLGMSNTHVSWVDAPDNGRVQCSKKGRFKDCYFHKVGKFQWPSGGIISNVDDMLRWAQVNLDEAHAEFSYLSSAHVSMGDSVAIPWFDQYKATQGLIWWHYRTSGGRRIICHGGNSPAQTSFLALDKSRRRAVVILCNIDGRALMNERQVMRTTALAMKILER